MNNSSNNKRIAKNTAYLYIRMLFTTLLSLYTARLVLNVLGIEDFGIYNVVGGVVTFMGFLTATMSSATQRYLTFDLGSGNLIKFQHTFSMLLNVYLAFCVISLLVLELVGPIYINKYMTIPPQRVIAAQWAFQFSLVSFLFSSFSVPYRASIVAYEKMDVYAYIGIAEVIMQLVMVLILSYISCDKLIAYSALMFLLQLSLIISIIVYCNYRLAGCRYQKYWNYNYFREIISYSGWNLFGSTTGVLNMQGQAIVLNFFFGPVVNAAKAISDRVAGMISLFSQNFYMAVTPQIIKSYATGEIGYMRSLVLNSSRYSFYLLLIVVVPLFVVMEPLLCIWLGKDQVSDEMIRFCQCAMIFSCVNILEKPITMAVRATGDIKKYQIMVGSLTLTFIPLCLVVFLFGAPAYYSLLLLSAIYFVVLFFRVYVVSPIISASPKEYIKKVLLPIFLVSFISLVLTCFVICFIARNNIHWLMEGMISFVIVVCICYFLGLNKNEKNIIRKSIIKFILFHK